MDKSSPAPSFPSNIPTGKAARNRVMLVLQGDNVLYRNFFVFLTYFLFCYIFYAIGKDIRSVLLEPGDSWIAELPMKVSSSSLSLWNPYLQSGTFALKDIAGFQALYLPTIIAMRIFPPVLALNLLILLHYTAAGFFTFLFLMKLDLNLSSSFMGGMFFMFSGFMVAHQGHSTMVMAASYLPIVLFFLEEFLLVGKVKILFLAAIAFALSILADYPACPLYIGIVTFPYILFRVLAGPETKGKNFFSKTLFIGSCAFVLFVLGSMLAAVQIVPVLESLNSVTREKISYSFFSSYSFPFQLLPILIFPYIYGGYQPSSLYQTSYFGPWNLTEMTGYMGVLPFLFALFAIIFFWRRNLQIYFWAGVSIFAFILVLGDSTPLYKLMYHVPVYNMFRASARNWLEVNFAVAILASLFVHYMMTDERLQKHRYYQVIYLSTGSLIVASLFILLLGKKWIENLPAQVLWSKTSHFTSPAVYLPLITIFVSIIVLHWLYRYRQDRAYWTLVTAIIFLDLFFFGHFFYPGSPSYKIFQNEPNPVANFLNSEGGDKSQYRILGLSPEDHDDQLFPDVNILYGFQAVNAYSNVWLKDYKELTTFESNGVSARADHLLQNSKILSSLSVKYIIANQREQKEVLSRVLVGTASDPGRKVINGFQDSKWQLISPAHVGKTTVALRAKPGEASLIQIPVKLQPGTVYTVIFKARMAKESETEEPLIVDLYGENYDGLAQEAHFFGPPYEAHQPRTVDSKGFRTFRALFYIGESAPESAFLRFFTYSEIAYQIKAIELFQSSAIVPNFRNPEWQTIPSSPLYLKRFESPEGIAVYENMNFLPRARFASQVFRVNTAAEAIDMFWKDENFNPGHTALVEDFPDPMSFNEGQVISTDYSDNNTVVLSVRTGERSFLVLSDSWYPGWRAFVDGEQAPIYRTNAVSRGIVIQGKGEHLVVFKFVPRSFYMGLTITCLIILGMILYILFTEKFSSTNRSFLLNKHTS